MRIGRGKHRDAKQPHQTGQNEATVVADTGRKPLRVRLPSTRRGKGLLLGACGIMVTAGVIGVFAWPSKQQPDDETYQKSKKKLLSLSEKSTNAAANNKAADSIPDLEAYIAAPDLQDDLKKDALTQLATTYHNAMQYDKAIETYDKLRQVEGKDTTTIAAGKALTYQAKGDKPNAITAYRQAIELAEQQKSTLKQGDGTFLTLQQQIVGYKAALKSLGAQ